MDEFVLNELSNADNFDAAGYLLANPDVAKAVQDGTCESAWTHFVTFGRSEGRNQKNMRFLEKAKSLKRERFRHILRDDMAMIESAGFVDYLTEDLRALCNIVHTDLVSSNNYRQEGLDLIRKHKDGLILDCGAGRRPIYYGNVVNFEIADYETTDVRGVGEKLPFKDNSFDAVFSLAVLEHVKDPFQCAREISRVLKPGGDLLCCVPFLQPMHGYPNHYYNMTKQGVQNLFESMIDINRHEVRFYTLPIWGLTWIVNSWVDGLSGEARDEFLNMKISDLRNSPMTYLNRDFVTQLSEEKNFELACGTTIFGTKKA